MISSNLLQRLRKRDLRLVRFQRTTHQKSFDGKSSGHRSRSQFSSQVRQESPLDRTFLVRRCRKNMLQLPLLSRPCCWWVKRLASWMNGRILLCFGMLCVPWWMSIRFSVNSSLLDLQLWTEVKSTIRERMSKTYIREHNKTEGLFWKRLANITNYHKS